MFKALKRAPNSPARPRAGAGAPPDTAPPLAQPTPLQNSSSRLSLAALFVALVAALGLGFWLGAQVSMRQAAAAMGVVTANPAEAGREPPEHHLLLRLREAREMQAQGLLNEAQFGKLRSELLGLSHDGVGGGDAGAGPGDGSVGDAQFPTFRGVAYSQTKHPLQGGSILTSTCPNKDPVHKIVFIKTHKTASSTLTNLFHRFGYKYGLNFALPADNMFYGWPSKGRASVKNIQPIGLYQEPYDVYASAHAVYSPREQDRVVPGATWVTILRSPTTHFRSAWKYWQIPQAIAAHGGPFDMEPEQFFEDVGEWEPKIGGQKSLIFNSFAYDLGFDYATIKEMEERDHEEDVAKILQGIEARFRVVLITDYMAESLLMMKRELCWPLDDVVFGSMKVSTGPQKPKTFAQNQKDPLFQKIRAYNWLDTRLYDHFNASLWGRVKGYQEEDRRLRESGSAPPPGYVPWDEELALFKGKIDSFTKRCEPLNYQHEDRHRAELEKTLPFGPTDEERACHLAYTDSKGYCKTLKREQGAPIDEIECYAQRPLTKFALLRLNNGADEALFGTVARRAHGFKQTLLVADKASAADAAIRKRVGSDRQGDMLYRLPTRYQAIRPSTREVLVGVRGMRWYKPIFEQLTGNGPAMYSYVVQHPVAAFLQDWERLRMPQRLRQVLRGHADVELRDFLESNNLRKQVELLRSAVALADSAVPGDGGKSELDVDDYCGGFIVNPLWCRFGFDPDDHLNDRETAKRFRGHVKHDFQVPLLAEYMDESLILVRQTICWRTRDFVYINADLWRSAQLPASVKEDKGLFGRISALVSMDMALYAELEAWFWVMAEQRPAWEEELAMFREERPKAIAGCGSNPRALMNLHRELTYWEKGCVLSVMTEAEYTDYFVEVEPIPTASVALPRRAQRGDCACADAKNVFACTPDATSHC